MAYFVALLTHPLVARSLHVSAEPLLSCLSGRHFGCIGSHGDPKIPPGAESYALSCDRVSFLRMADGFCVAVGPTAVAFVCVRAVWKGCASGSRFELGIQFLVLSCWYIDGYALSKCMGS